LAEQALRGDPYPPIGSAHTVEGHDFTIDEAFIADVDSYVQHVRSVPWYGTYTPEGRVNYSRSLGVPFNLAFGTSDCWGFSQDASGRYLEVMDLKMGRKAVNPFENSQMTLYAAGVLDGMAPVMTLPPSAKVRFTIYQPRLAHRPFQWVTTVGWVQNRVLMLRPAAHAAIAYHNGTATQDTWAQFPELPGDHCHYCTRKTQCGAFKAKVIRTAQPPVVWDAQLYGMKSAVLAYFEDMEALATTAALAGTPYPGTKLVKGRSSGPKLLINQAQLRELAKALGIEGAIVWTEEVWATPAKVRDAFKRHGVQPADIAKVLVTPEPAPVLALTTDPRPEVSRAVNTSAFGGTPQ
jgi:hypothetical protein